MLSALKNFDANQLNMEEMVELAAYARTLQDEFIGQGVEVPEWLTLQAKVVSREIKAKNAAEIEKKLREAKGRREVLKTPGQKKADLDRTIAALEKKLAAVS